MKYKKPSALSADLVTKLAADISKRLAGLNVEDFTSEKPSTRSAAFRTVRKLAGQHLSASSQAVTAGLLVGTILLYAKRSKLYRRGKPKQTFAAFALTSFGISESYAHRLPAIASNWLPIAEEPIQPTSLDSLRPLKRLDDPAKKQEAWRIAASAASNGAPEAKQVDAAVRALLGEQPKSTSKSKLQLLAEDVIALLDRQEFSAARSRLSQAIGASDLAVIAKEDAPAKVNDVLYQGTDCVITHRGIVLVVEADPARGQDMINLGLIPNDIKGQWVFKLKGKKPVDIDAFIAKVREALKQQVMAGVIHG